jgi:putative transposase
MFCRCRKRGRCLRTFLKRFSPMSAHNLPFRSNAWYGNSEAASASTLKRPLDRPTEPPAERPNSMIITYRYRVKDRSAKKTLARMAYATNQVWNYLVARHLDIEARYRSGAPKRKWGSHFDLTKLCKGVGAELGIHQQTAQEVCRQFAQSRDKDKRAPRFRSSFGSKRALGWVPFQEQSRQTKGNSVTYLGKSYRFWEGNRPLPGNAKGGCFVEDAQGRWYVCFHVEVERVAAANGAIGIDLGLKSFAALSDGRVIDAQRVYRRYEVRLAIAQRAGNKRRAKAIHAKIKNCRKDFLHKLSTDLAREYAFIAVGNVNASGLAKTSMAKSVLDAGWSTFRTMLSYKSAGYIEVDEKFTTQSCSECGSIAGPKGRAGLNERRWICDGCGTSHDRDVNSAVNIKRLGLSAQARVDESRRIAA